MNVCELTLAKLTPGQEQVLQDKSMKDDAMSSERSRSLSPSQLCCGRSLSSYDVIYLAIFVQNPYYIIKMCHWFKYHELSYVWDLILTHISFAPGFALKSGCDTKSLKVCFIHRNWAQHAPAAMYSASTVESATRFCFLELHDTKNRPRNWKVPVVLFRSTFQHALSF